MECLWCSNPESQEASPQIFYKKQQCIGCNLCSRVCKNSALNAPDRCQKCYRCIEVCPSGARMVVGKTMSVYETVDALAKDRLFYRRSGGGVTISGGEPLSQYHFTRAVIDALKDKRIHVVVETTGFAKWEVLWSTLKGADLVLYDLKIYDSQLHRKYTGVANELILQNAKKLSQAADVTFRIPIIPGYNNSEPNLTRLADFIKACNTEAEVHLLAYHNLGNYKYQYLGKQPVLTDTKPPAAEDMAIWLNLFRSKNLNVNHIGLIAEYACGGC